MTTWNQGQFKPKNTSKCINVRNGSYPTFRSNYERKFMEFLDLNVAIKEWGSETLKIPYTFSIDRKEHNYIVDFIFTAITTDGSLKTYMIEVKDTNESPVLNEFGDLIPPPPPKKKSAKSMRNYLNKLQTLEKNRCKWLAAKEYCRKNNIIFEVITEQELFN